MSPQSKKAPESRTIEETDELEERTIRARLFPYTKQVAHPLEPGKTMLNQREAQRGETVELMPHDIERGERLGAFLEPNERVEDLGTGTRTDDFSAVGASDTELIDWIKNDNPSAQDVIDASENDVETAEKLLVAENAATGNDPRKEVVAGLEAVISNGKE